MTRRGPLAWIDRKITEAQTCPGCGCNADQWREDCDCLRQGCACAGAEQDDTGNWEREPGPDAAIPDAAGAADLPPAAEPYTPPKRTTQPPITSRPSAAPTGSAGGNVASIEEVRGGIAAANEKANEALGALTQAHADLESAQATLLRTTEGSGQADVSQANGMLAQAVADIEVLRQQVSAAISSAEDVGNRL